MTPGKLPGIPVAFYNRLHFATAAQQQKESRSHCWRSVGGRWAVKFPDNTVSIISKMEDFTMLGYTAYQLSIVGPFALVCFFGAAVMWFSGIR